MSSSVQSQIIAEPRIYYHEEKLQGKPVESEVITRQIFDFIVNESPSMKYRDMEKTRLVKKDGALESAYVPMFRYATIRKDGIPYKSSDHGSFYLPGAIILHDINDVLPFPSEFYFIAHIGDHLELCRASGGDGIRWYQLADRYETVSDPAILKKVEETLKYLKDRVGYELEKKKEEEEKRAKEVASRPQLSQAKKAPYLALTEMCLGENPRKKGVLALIDRLKAYEDGKEDYASTYDEFAMYMNHNNIPFIITVDWKESIEELEAWIRAALEENFKKTFRFDMSGAGRAFDEDSTVSGDGVFLAFDNQLRALGLQIGMIETDSDSYQFVVHKVEDAKKIHALPGFRIRELTPDWQP